MALAYYVNCISTEAIKLKRDFSFSNRNVKIAIKSGITCVIAVMLAYVLELQTVVWCAITSLIMVQPNLGASFKKGMLRICGTVAGALAGVIIFGLFVQNHIFFSIAILAIGTVCYYRKERSEYSYFWYLGMVTFMLVAVEGLEKVYADEIIYVAVNRGMEIVLGVIVSLIVNLYIWPFFATDDMVVKVKSIRKKTSNIIEEVYSHYVELKPFNSSTVIDLYQDLEDEIKKFNGLHSNALLERKINKNYFLETKNEIMRISEWVEKLINFYASINKFKNLSFHKKFTPMFTQLLSNIADIHKAIGENDSKKINKLKNKSEIILHDIELRYKKNVQRGRNKSYPITDVLLFHEFMLILHELFGIYFDIYCMKNLSVNLKKANSVIDKYEINTQATFGIYRSKFLGININLHIPSLKYAFKASITLLVVIWGWWALELPQGQGGINIAIAVMVVSQADAVSSNLKGIHRLMGCLIGAALGLTFLFFQVESTVFLCLCLFLVSSFAAYVQCGGAGISYMGMQIGLAYFVATINDFTQQPDIVHIVYRFIGIFFGIFCVWAIGMLFWRDDYRSRLRLQIFEYIKQFKNINLTVSNTINSDLMIEELKSIDFTISRLNIFNELSDDVYKLLENWLIYSRRLIFIINTLVNTEETPLKFIASIKPVIINDIQNLLYDVGDHAETISSKTLDIEKIVSEIEDMKLYVRVKNLLGDKDMEFKQKYSHTITILKRIVLRASDIHRLKNEILSKI
ncbi:MAG TPA: FUSC family protein [Victivallales bacterium]|nr:FUSC family protein [Victivallales bacterium]